MKEMKKLVSIGLILFSGLALAQSETPKCATEGVGIKDNEIVFNNSGTVGQYVFLLHNTSKGAVLVNHMKSDPGAGAGWASKLDAGNWSMIAVGQANFSMGCMLYQPPKFGLVDCGSVLSVCAMPTTSIAGSYWVAENQPLDKILEKAKARGIM